MLIWRLRREERTERHFDSFGFWWNVRRRVEWWNIKGAKGKHVQYIEEGVNNWRRSFDELSPPAPNLRSNRTAMGPSPPQRSGQFESVGRNWEGVMFWDFFFLLSFILFHCAAAVPSLRRMPTPWSRTVTEWEIKRLFRPHGQNLKTITTWVNVNFKGK